MKRISYDDFKLVDNIYDLKYKLFLIILKVKESIK